MPLLSIVLSFVVPAYNEEFELPRTLDSIHAAAAGREYEIIVVDDASTDRTAEIARNAGTKVVSINRRQIAAARNAGARAGCGEILFFVDADTRINHKHVAEAIDALSNGYAGGSAQVQIGGAVPIWSRVFLRVFCTIYFAFRLGAGAFLFTTKQNFDAVGGFDENLFVGEEVYFSLALHKLGRFRILPEPIVTSGRKLRIYSAREILSYTFYVLTRGPRAARSRNRLDIWYDGKRETGST
ncbi:MAG TPA: glycosyltransferase [Chthoniobacterales bacterium]|nr:glycosyltransferase [Chthoniobacterales bacterium]